MLFCRLRFASHRRSTARRAIPDSTAMMIPAIAPGDRRVFGLAALSLEELVGLVVKLPPDPVPLFDFAEGVDDGVPCIPYDIVVVGEFRVEEDVAEDAVNEWVWESICDTCFTYRTMSVTPLALLEYLTARWSR